MTSKRARSESFDDEFNGIRKRFNIGDKTLKAIQNNDSDDDTSSENEDNFHENEDDTSSENDDAENEDAKNNDSDNYNTSSENEDSEESEDDEENSGYGSDDGSDSEKQIVEESDINDNNEEENSEEESNNVLNNEINEDDEAFIGIDIQTTFDFQNYENFNNDGYINSIYDKITNNNIDKEYFDLLLKNIIIKDDAIMEKINKYVESNCTDMELFKTIIDLEFCEEISNLYVQYEMLKPLNIVDMNILLKKAEKILTKQKIADDTIYMFRFYLTKNFSTNYDFNQAMNNYIKFKNNHLIKNCTSYEFDDSEDIGCYILSNKKLNKKGMGMENSKLFIPTNIKIRRLAYIHTAYSRKLMKKYKYIYRVAFMTNIQPVCVLNTTNSMHTEYAYADTVVLGARTNTSEFKLPTYIVDKIVSSEYITQYCDCKFLKKPMNYAKSLIMDSKDKQTLINWIDERVKETKENKF